MENVCISVNVYIGARGKIYYFTVVFGEKNVENTDEIFKITLILTSLVLEIYSPVLSS